MEYAEKYLIKRNAWGEPLTLHFVRTVGIHIVVSKLTRISTVAFGNTHDKGSPFLWKRLPRSQVYIFVPSFVPSLSEERPYRWYRQQSLFCFVETTKRTIRETSPPVASIVQESNLANPPTMPFVRTVNERRNRGSSPLSACQLILLGHRINRDVLLEYFNAFRRYHIRCRSPRGCTRDKMGCESVITITFHEAVY